MSSLPTLEKWRWFSTVFAWKLRGASASVAIFNWFFPFSQVGDNFLSFFLILESYFFTQTNCNYTFPEYLNLMYFFFRFFHNMDFLCCSKVKKLYRFPLSDSAEGNFPVGHQCNFLLFEARSKRVLVCEIIPFLDTNKTDLALKCNGFVTWEIRKLIKVNNRAQLGNPSFTF